ncbi:MAG: c-type cytochrome [Sulfurimonas sp.]|nr:c-type cytochrome [Sulfurimonas sp.]
MNITKILLLAFFTTNLLYADIIASDWLRPNSVPTPYDNQLSDKRIELGKLLYFDKRLSSSNEISCATCHDPKLGWSDALSKSIGHDGAKGPRNSPTIINTAYQEHQFWDGRVKSLEEQALGPIEAEVEMNMPLKKLIVKLKNIDGYVKLFKEAYPESDITKETLAKAIASFERTVLSTESPFDRYVKGDEDAVNKDAKDGFKLFRNKGRCTDCHSGFNFTDGSFHNLGLGDKDKGRIKTRKGVETSTGEMKTPTLRDITKTWPYFHDGSVKTLHEAVAICGNGGRFTDAKNLSHLIIDRDLNIDEIEKIVAFLRTLEGKDLDISIPTKFPR